MAEPVARCYACQRDKPAGEFVRDGSKPRGHASICRACDRVKSRRYYAENRERKLAYLRGRERDFSPEQLAADAKRKREFRARHPNLLLVRDAKAGGCVDCGRQAASRELHWDHVRGVKLFELSQADRFTRAEVEAELAKCEVRCVSCHSKRHRLAVVA